MTRRALGSLTLTHIKCLGRSGVMDESRAACRMDKSTFASLTAFSFAHLDLDWTVDFEAKTVSGMVPVSKARLEPHEVVGSRLPSLRASQAQLRGR